MSATLERNSLDLTSESTHRVVDEWNSLPSAVKLNKSVAMLQKIYAGNIFPRSEARPHRRIFYF